MYQPYDPFGFQPYNDPQPEHYAAGVPQGMPQPSRPSGLFGSTDPPGYPSFQDQYYQGANNSYDAQFGSQPYGSHGQGPQAQQPSYYPANPAPPVPHTGSHHYPPHTGQSGAGLSHTASHHYPPTADSSFYPSTSSAPPYSNLQPPAETSWAPPSYPPQDERPVHSTHSVPKRDEKESVRFSVDEAQKIIKELKETNKNLTLQLKNSRESSTKELKEKEARIEQLQKEVDGTRRQQGDKEALIEQLKKEVDGARRQQGEKESEWQQRMSAKEQESEAKERDWAERLSKAEQESAAILARFTKLQLDADSGRAFLLESNSAQEAELRKLKEEARKYDTEVVRLRDESNKQEAELMKLRDETNKLLDEITQMVDDKAVALATIKHLEEEKHRLEDQLNGSSDGIVAAKNAAAAEREKLVRRIDDLEDELENAHDLCEKRRLRIESMENEELPTLNSQIDLMMGLEKKAKDQIAQLQEKLEAAEHARDTLEKQLAGESKSATDELQRLRFELDSHRVGKSDSEKLASELVSEKKMLEQKVAQVEDEKREALGRISKLEMSLNEATQARTELEEELVIVQETMNREAEDNETAQAEYRSKVEQLEEEVKSLASAKSALETQVLQSDTKITETERLLHATEEMLKVLNEDLEQKQELETKAKGMESLGEEKTALEAKLTALEEDRAQMAEQISELSMRLELLEKEKLKWENEYDSFDALVGKLEGIIEEKDAELEGAKGEVMAKRRLEREIRGLNLDLSKAKAEMERVKTEMELVSKIGQDQSVKILDQVEELEARISALQEDKKRLSVQASQLGEQMLLLETENKEVKQSFTDIQIKFVEIVAERDELQQENRNLRNK